MNPTDTHHEAKRNFKGLRSMYRRIRSEQGMVLRRRANPIEISYENTAWRAETDYSEAQHIWACKCISMDEELERSSNWRRLATLFSRFYVQQSGGK